MIETLIFSINMKNKFYWEYEDVSLHDMTLSHAAPVRILSIDHVDLSDLFAL